MEDRREVRVVVEAMLEKREMEGKVVGALVDLREGEVDCGGHVVNQREMEDANEGDAEGARREGVGCGGVVGGGVHRSDCGRHVDVNAHHEGTGVGCEVPRVEVDLEFEGAGGHRERRSRTRQSSIGFEECIDQIQVIILI